jgi:uncharacterized protein (TIGR00106 family)|uniref:Thiamine-binding protein domain-containing protein n=1 Tax=Eutreptiella gymnastica TaxID=73025 RepID=A0A7S4GDG9_9EUGL|mmetsp:Transcript_16555/g.28999  ORF Transcript_16555/g.28999 Transcript_16555/m.28999 type:complete len:123 (+) Transcript_16555:25-393(+)
MWSRTASELRPALCQRSYSTINPFKAVIADFQIVPMGVGQSVSHYVAACEKVLRKHKLNPKLHAYGTNVEGEWESVLAALKECHTVLHEMGAPRVNTAVKIGTRTDKSYTMADKIEAVTTKM